MDLIYSEIQPENLYFQITSNVSLSLSHFILSIALSLNIMASTSMLHACTTAEKHAIKTFCLQQSIFVCHVNTSYVWLAYENAATKP